MATTSPHLAIRAIGAVEESGVRFAILHGEAALAGGVLSSDVDIVADRSVGDLVNVLAEPWAARGLYPVIVWPYDVGGTGSLFLATSTADEGVQIDVLCDRKGQGRYGVRSELLLGAVQPGERFPTVAPPERDAYLLAKRILKGQTQEFERMIEGRVVEGAALRVLRPQIANLVRSCVANGSVPRVRRFPKPAHVMGRLRRPVGAWIEVRGSSAELLASDLVGRFGRFLPHVACIPAPGPVSWTTSVAPIRWRAGIVASHGASQGWMSTPDVVISTQVPAEKAYREVVRSLTRRNVEVEPDRG